MSDFLDINGIPVSVADGSAISPAPIDIGDQERALDGSKLKTRIALKQQYGWTTTPMVASDALAWKSLVEGLGHHWSFDSSVYSSKGLGPTAASSNDYQQNNAGGKYGGDLQIGTTNDLATFGVTPTGLDANAYPYPNGGFTVMFWARQQDGVTWKHYIAVWGAGLSGPTWYINGVTGTDGITLNCVGGGSLQTFQLLGYGCAQNGQAAINGWLATHSYAANALVSPSPYNGRFYKVTAGGGGNSGGSQPTWPTTLGNTVTDGALTWTDQGPMPLFIDDLVVLPFTIPTSWVSPLYTFCSAQAYPDNPKLYVSGLFPQYAGLMVGKVGQTKLIQGVLAGTFTQNLQTVEFQLEEA